MINPSQLKLIHAAARFAKLNDEQYRTLLRSAAGVESAKNLDQAKFEDVMAVLEDLCEGRLPPPGSVTKKPTHEQLKAIESLAGDVMMSVNQLCEATTGGRVMHAENLSAVEARWLLDWLFAQMATCPRCGPGMFSLVKYDRCPHCHEPVEPPRGSARPRARAPLTAAPCTPSRYWRSKVADRGTAANARMVWKIRELSQKLHRYELGGLVRRFSQQRTGDAEQLTPREAWQLIEMMKAAILRESDGATKRRACGDQSDEGQFTEDSREQQLLPF